MQKTSKKASETPIIAEMSEWFKEHDWKSCVRLKRTGGSNPLLCANKNTRFIRVFFVVCCREEIEGGFVFSEVRASNIASYRPLKV